MEDEKSEGWKKLVKVKVAGDRKAEICSVRKDVGGVWMLADILALLAVVGCGVLVWKEEWRWKVLSGWRREKVSWRPEDVRLCKETRREKLPAEGMPALCRLKCSSVYTVRKLSECCCLHAASSVWSVACNFLLISKNVQNKLQKSLFS